MPGIAHALRRARDIIRRDPAKLLKAFTFRGWRNFTALTRERQVSQAALLADIAVRNRDSFTDADWNKDSLIAQRRYASYDAYVAHQREKFDQLHGVAYVSSEKAVQRFRRRFELVAELPMNARVICLAARRGEEVEAFISLGHFAVGIDLNPGDVNRYVVTGDFHALQFADASVDCAYTNSLDHAFDLDKITAEIRRVVRPSGIFLVDIVYGHDEGYVPGGHDAMHWPRARDFAALLAEKTGFALTSFRDLGPHGSMLWTQAVLRKQA